MRFSAIETIDLRRSEFEWRASTGPFGCITVNDALKDAQATLEVRLFGCIRIAAAKSQPAAVKGEIMRYLAELAWAPDAILSNNALIWTVIDDRSFRVSAGHDNTRGTVDLRLDDNGRIDSISAEDRPRQEGGRFVERHWHGRFFDYRLHQGRWLPFAGEVGWVLDGALFTAWRGEITSWAVS
ncbi:MAG: hypothetical protein P4L90_29230 [Rhodopila sp.]|nr:hypothetical protein [Rhodopila sp.]